MLLVATVWGAWLGIATALASALAFNFFHIPPTGRFTIAEGENWVGLVVFFVAEALFNELAVDGFFMEWDDARSGGFEPLRFLPKGKVVVLGLVTTKFGEMESKDALKRRIDEASKYAPLEQLALSPQCGFSSTVHGNNIAVEAQRNKLRLVVEVAQEVWG